MSGHRLTAFLKHAAYTFKSSRRSYTQPSSPIELQNHFRRGGRNLSERFRRLEKMLSVKHNPNQTITDTPQPRAQVLTPTPTPQQRSTVKTFRGLVVPEVPNPPEPDECCMSGCAVCVHDLYQESLDEYNTTVASVRASLTAMKVPVEEWPSTIRPEAEGQSPPSASSASRSAFQEMERALKARREARVQTVDVRVDNLKDMPLPRWRRQRSGWKGLDLGALYEGVRWILYSNR